MPPAAPDATALLLEGEGDALDALFPLVYGELHRIARRQLRRQPAGHTLNTTALVHEAYLKLIHAERVEWQDRAHFYALSARAMRQILLNYARDRQALKRGGDHHRITFTDDFAVAHQRAVALLDLDAALTEMADLDERMSRVVELRFFGGLSEAEIGHVLGISERTVRREWRQARAWLTRALVGGGEETGAPREP